MRVFNLTTEPHFFKGKVIPANGGYLDIQMSFIPDRDRELETAKILAFGSLPAWWIAKHAEPAPAPKNALVELPAQAVTFAEAPSEPKIEVKGELKTEKKDGNKSKG